MSPEIKNFVLTRYKRKKFDNTPPHISPIVNKLDMEEWDEVQEKLLHQQIKQLRKFYPNSNLHLLTNKDIFLNNVFIHHNADMPSSHLSKMFVYGLLNEETMYLDNDIILNRRFSEKELPKDNHFNLYCRSRTYDIQALAKRKLPFKLDHHYNAGIIYIPYPNEDIRKELFDIHEEYFSDSEKIKSTGRWSDSDELPVAFYIRKYNLSMKTFSEIGKHRDSVKNIDAPQSIHYTGIEIKTKYKCLKEYASITRKKYL